MIIIKIILWTLLAVLLLIILALAVPVRAAVRYNNEITLVIKYLFLKIPIDLDGEKKKDKKNKKAKKSKKLSPKKKTGGDKKAAAAKDAPKIENRKSVSPANNDGKSKVKTKNKKSKKDKPPKKENAAVKWFKKTFKERGIKGVINVLKEFARLAMTFLKPIFKHIRLRRIDLDVTVAYEDAADTAVNYGYICSGVYPALSVLLRVMRCGGYSVNIRPDFNKKELEFDVFAEISLVPWFVVFGAVHALFDFIVLKIQGKV